jgi:magnesium-transporting ATPase (P-type)
MNDFIPCVGVLGLVFLIFAFIVIMRYINYQETMKLAEKGLVKPALQNGNGKGTLIWGIIITAIGLALTLGLLSLGTMIGSTPFGPWMLAGLLPTFFGLALILIYVLTRDDGKDKQIDDQKVEQLEP